MFKIDHGTTPGWAQDRNLHFTHFPADLGKKYTGTSILASGCSPNPVRGGLFIDTETPPDFSFCFSAARTWSKRIDLDGAAMELRSRYGPPPRRRKTKRKGWGVIFGYKQATPNGVWGLVRDAKPINSRNTWTGWLSEEFCHAPA